MTAASATTLPGRLRRARWYHPEWTVAVVAAAAWTLTIVAPGHGGAGWAVMAAAMMLPPALPAVRRVAMSGKWARRGRAAAGFAAAYLAVWALYGTVLLACVRWSQVPAHADGPLVAALLTAALWELTPYKRRWVRAGHRTPPLPPDGWRADRACLLAGLRHGGASVGACWALMLPMTVTAHLHLPLMILLTAIAVAEESLVKGTRLTHASATALLLAALVIAV
ncbi:hypothetical protein Ato02nite_036280 [Paractinoplanes toevensis]|uniref:Uncharacterized protein n=1 Tax=Paractinoplanes toevensis TaxID=571911 RepID=A0A919W4N2_9ACTN|nr:hypothetical protein Ato02nite_036280 [Actinoplanes toevensis]